VSRDPKRKRIDRDLRIAVLFATDESAESGERSDQVREIMCELILLARKSRIKSRTEEELKDAA
jgi:hypothetical protein